MRAVSLSFLPAEDLVQTALALDVPRSSPVHRNGCPMFPQVIAVHGVAPNSPLASGAMAGIYRHGGQRLCTRKGGQACRTGLSMPCLLEERRTSQSSCGQCVRVCLFLCARTFKQHAKEE